MEKNKLIDIEKKVDELAVLLEKSRIKEYVELTDKPLKLIYLNLISGIAKGLGMAIGFTALAAITVYILKSWVNLPLVGQYIAKLLNIVENYR